MKKLFFILLMTVLFSSRAYAAEYTDFDRAYANLPVFDFFYEDNQDPDENQDYADYLGSPYPLVRISVPLECKKTKIIPGYYLITIRNRSGIDFAMFKQNGKIAGLVPVYEKQAINPETYYPKPTAPKSKTKKFFGGIKNTLAKPFKPHMKPPPPARYDVKTKIIGKGVYFELDYYREEYLYKMLFRIIQ